MPTERKSPDNEIYQIKVTLMRTAPPIWRRLLVGADITLSGLHDLLQLAMGWTNSHMHEFRFHPEHKELLEWEGRHYDPEKFSIEATNPILHGKKRAARSSG